MSQIAAIKSALSAMAVSVFADSTTIEYRNLTSNPNANPRTYGAWTALAGARVIDNGETQVQDIDSGIWFSERTAQLRIPSQLGVALNIRSQVRTGGSTGTVWAIRSVQPGGAGSVQPYQLVVRMPMMQDPRKGGV